MARAAASFSKSSLLSPLGSRGAALVLVVSLQVLLHVVGPSKLLLATQVRALDGLLGCVDLGMSRGVARSGKRLLAAMGVSVAAWISFARTL